MSLVPSSLTGIPLASWTTHQVSQWLTHINMKKYTKNFSSQKITGADLYELTESELSSAQSEGGGDDDGVGRGLGITNKAHVKKIFTSVKKLKFSQATRDQKHQSKRSGRETHLIIDKISSIGKKKTNEDNERNVGINLRVNNVVYTFGVKCTFCQDPDKVAFVHCPGCADFLCEQCDYNVHVHAKRMNHVRTVISMYDMDRHAFRITAFFRTISAVKRLRENCRFVFERFYDSNTRKHYYYNTSSKLVQWNKPYCLKSFELVPYISYERAACVIQGCFRVFQCRRIVGTRIVSMYDKIYDRDTGFFYYFYKGFPLPSVVSGDEEIVEKPENDDSDNTNANNIITQNILKSFNAELAVEKKLQNLTSETTPTPTAPLIKSKYAISVSWTRPRLLPKTMDCKLVFTRDLACLRIQHFFRLHKAKQFLKALVRKYYGYHYDPISGKQFYQNKVNKKSQWTKPLLLGNEIWDENDMRLWDEVKVSYMLRRLGFKKFGYIQGILDYKIDGLLLLTFEWEDYVLLGISKSMHIKAILLQLHKFPWYHRHVDEPADIERRDRLRLHHNLFAAAVIIQRMYRRRFLAVQRSAFMEVVRMKKQAADREERRVQGMNWWFDQIPVLQGGVGNHSLNPNVKSFGKRGVFKGVLGWGNPNPNPNSVSNSSSNNSTRRGGNGFEKVDNKLGIVTKERRGEEGGWNDEHCSRFYTNKLIDKSGRFSGDMSNAMNSLEINPMDASKVKSGSGEDNGGGGGRQKKGMRGFKQPDDVLIVSGMPKTKVIWVPR